MRAVFHLLATLVKVVLPLLIRTYVCTCECGVHVCVYACMYVCVVCTVSAHFIVCMCEWCAGMVVCVCVCVCVQVCLHSDHASMPSSVYKQQTNKPRRAS